MSALVKKLIAKKNKATVSTNQILIGNDGNNSNKKDATIPMPQIRYITFLIFLLRVIFPDDFVNRKNELYASSKKKTTALQLCIVALNLLSNMNVPTLPGNAALAVGNKQIIKPAIPEHVNKMSSTFE